MALYFAGNYSIIGYGDEGFIDTRGFDTELIPIGACTEMHPVRHHRYRKFPHYNPIQGTTSYHMPVTAVNFSLPYWFCCSGLTVGIDGTAVADVIITLYGKLYRHATGKFYRHTIKKRSSREKSFTIPKEYYYMKTDGYTKWRVGGPVRSAYVSFRIWGVNQQKIHNMPPEGWVTGAYISGTPSNSGEVERIDFNV